MEETAATGGQLSVIIFVWSMVTATVSAKLSDAGLTTESDELLRIVPPIIESWEATGIAWRTEVETVERLIEQYEKLLEVER